MFRLFCICAVICLLGGAIQTIYDPSKGLKQSLNEVWNGTGSGTETDGTSVIETLPNFDTSKVELRAN